MIKREKLQIIVASVLLVAIMATITTLALVSRKIDNGQENNVILAGPRINQESDKQTVVTRGQVNRAKFSVEAQHEATSEFEYLWTVKLANGAMFINAEPTESISINIEIDQTDANYAKYNIMLFVRGVIRQQIEGDENERVVYTERTVWTHTLIVNDIPKEQPDIDVGIDLE